MASLNKNLNNFFNNNKFLGSFQSFKDIPYSDIKKECCFIGRSNVGKSSLINSLTKTKKLAKTSKTPGRTQAINVFLISEKINMIDLNITFSAFSSFLVRACDSEVRMGFNYDNSKKYYNVILDKNYQKDLNGTFDMIGQFIKK